MSSRLPSFRPNPRSAAAQFPYPPLVERLDFEFDYDGDLTTARLISDFGRGVVEQHWSGLDEQRIPRDDDDRNPFLRFAVNSNNQEEVAVYLGIAWALTAGTERYAIPTWSRDDVAGHLRRDDFDLVRWEYAIEPEESSWPDRDRGFVTPGNPLPLRPPPTEWQQEHHDEAGLFGVPDLPGLTAMTAVTLTAAWGDVNLFGLADTARYHRLVELLRTATPPAVGQLLGPSDVLVVITVGVDLGFYDSLYAVAAGDLRRDWSTIIESFRRRVEAYEATVDSVRSVEQLFAALSWLQHDLDAPGISYPNVHRALVEDVPEVRLTVEQHIADYEGHVRPHLLFGELARFALAAHRRGDADLSGRCLRFLGTALASPDERVAELVTASFFPAVASTPGGRAFISTWPVPLREALPG
jgi:hypothetical protein